MKSNYLTFIFFSLFSLTIYSQPTLDYTSLPQVGDTFAYYILETESELSVFPGDSGSNVTWDFSTIDLSTAIDYTIHYANPMDTPFSGSFPNSNLTKVYSWAQMEYYTKTNDSISFVGNYMDPTTRFYHDGILKLAFPSAYGDTIFDDFASNFVQNGNSITRTGNVQIINDGYGTLILPDKTIPNAIRIKTIQETIDVSSGTTIYTETYYHWYHPDINDYVLSFYISYYSGGISSFANIMQSSFLAHIGTENIETKENFKLYPNPATNSVNIEFHTLVPNSFIDIYTLDGQLVQSIEVQTKNNTIDVSDYSKGVYILKFISPENVYLKRLIVK